MSGKSRGLRGNGLSLDSSNREECRAMRGLLALGLGVVFSLAAPVGAQTTDSQWDGTPQKEFLESAVQQKYQCMTCHTITDLGGTVGPILNMVGLRRSKEWLGQWLDNPVAVKPGTLMPKFPFKPDELEMAVDYLSKMKRPLRTQAILSRPDASVEKGQALFEDYDCYACHRIGDKGRFVGPDLTFVGVRKTVQWERIWLRDPEGFTPGTFMPNFGIPEVAIRDLAAYLHSLQGQSNEAARAWELKMSLMTSKNDIQRGELVWKRLGCWSCHGQSGKGGVRNPNAAAGHETIPGGRDAGAKFTQEAFLARLVTRSEVPTVREDAMPKPFFCPAYPKTTLDQQEQDDLWAYIRSLAPDPEK